MRSWPAVYAGEDITIRVPNVRTDTGGEIDLDAATAVEWQLRRRPREPGQEDDDDENPVILSKALTAGITVDDADVLIALEPDDTAELAGTYYADLWATIAGKRRLIQPSSKLPILPSVNAP